MQKSKSQFITFEGIDGCGKSTQARLLHERLKFLGVPIMLTKEPTDDVIGKVIRSNFLSGNEKCSSNALQMLFAADRYEHINADNGILANLNEGISVICDRYYLSSMAYGLDPVNPYWGCLYPILKQIHGYVNSLLKPDLVIYINIDPEIAYQRINSRAGDKEIFETVDRLTTLQEAYNYVISKSLTENIIRVDGSLNENELSDVIFKHVTHLFGLE